jgi:hypothetical protein
MDAGGRAMHGAIAKMRKSVMVKLANSDTKQKPWSKYQ